MSPNSIKNLTYLAVALCVVALVFLVYNSIKQKTDNQADIVGNIDMETAIGEDSLYSDIIGDDNSSGDGLLGAASEDEVTGPEVTEGDLVSPDAYADKSAKINKGVAEITVDEDTYDEPISAERPTINAPAKSSGSSSKSSGIKPKSSTAKPAPGTPVGNAKPAVAATLYVVAGSFINKDGASAMVTTLKKQGFAKAEVVKSGDKYWASAGKFNNRKEADAMVKQLSNKKIDALVRTKS